MEENCETVDDGDSGRGCRIECQDDDGTRAKVVIARRRLTGRVPDGTRERVTAYAACRDVVREREALRRKVVEAALEAERTRFQ